VTREISPAIGKTHSRAILGAHAVTRVPLSRRPLALLRLLP
jgi:hypothetical protein